MNISAHWLLGEQGFLENRTVTVQDGCICAVADQRLPGGLQAEYLTPGLVDAHCHGGEGFNARDFGLDEIRPFLEKMLASGVTDFLMTLSTGTKARMRHGMDVTRQAMALQKEGKLGGARIRGVHLEGPFLSLSAAGAMQTSAILPPSPAAFDDFFAGDEDMIREVTLAPEEPGADELMLHLKKKGIRIQAGHTNATYDQARHAFACGAGSLCHSFNGCRGIHHREPGVVLAALENEHIYMEAICDLVHLHPAILRLIYRMKGPDRMMAISDSTVTHGLPDGEYHVEGYDIVVKDGVSRTAQGNLDGGGAYLDQAVRNLVSIGIPLDDAFLMACRTPARRLGLDGLGVLRPGAADHLVGWSKELHPLFAVLDGQVVSFR